MGSECTEAWSSVVRVLTMVCASGHTMSQADAISLEGEELPAITGCYRQFEHGMPEKLPSIDGDQVR